MAKIKIKAISGETYLDEAADDLTFGGLRAKLTAVGRMTPNDTFAVDGSAIAREYEDTLTVAAVWSEALVIELRGPKAAEKKLIRVTTPTETRSLELATDTTLGALRTALGASMSAGDGFTFPDGTSVATQDEATLKVSDVLREKDTVVVQPSVNARITVRQGSRSWAVRFDRSKTLAALREQLVAEKILGSNDVFTAKEGGDILKSEEATIVVASVLVGDSLVVKEVKEVVPRTPTASTTSLDAILASKEWSLTDGVSTTDLTSWLNKYAFPTTGASTPMDRWAGLSLEAKKGLFLNLSLYRALRMCADLEDRSEIPRSYRKVVSIIPVSGEPAAVEPQKRTDDRVDYVFSRRALTLRTRGIKTAELSGGAYGVALSSTATHDHETMFTGTSRTLFIQAVHLVRAVKLKLNEEDLHVEPAFTAAIEDALGRSSSLNQYLALLAVLDEYGHYLATELTLGGQLVAGEQHTITTRAEADKKITSFKTKVQGSYEQFEAGAGYGQSDTTESGSSSEEQSGTTFREVIGGDLATGTVASWTASLGKVTTWQVIEFEGLVPTIQYLAPALRTRCVALIRQHYQHDSTTNKTILNMSDYVSAYTRDLTSEFA